MKCIYCNELCEVNHTPKYWYCLRHSLCQVHIVPSIVDNGNDEINYIKLTQNDLMLVISYSHSFMFIVKNHEIIFSSNDLPEDITPENFYQRMKKLIIYK